METLDRLGIPFSLLNASRIAEGALDGHRVLLVPGGWSSHKMRALGETGCAAVKDFVREGGGWLGFCGGAGLALTGGPSLGLVNVGRMPLSERLPNAGGEVWLEGIPDHPVWRDLPSHMPASVWWPSQFQLGDSSDCRPIATYHKTGNGFRVADLVVSDLDMASASWEEWERLYGINLNPARLLGEPAILECRSGKGTLILSYPHLETPGDGWGNRLLENILRYLDRLAVPYFPRASRQEVPEMRDIDVLISPETVACLKDAGETVRELIVWGEYRLLWRRRNHWLLDWRRGIRGLEYGTLDATMTAMVHAAERLRGGGSEPDPLLDAARCLASETADFCRAARRLLLEEKIAGQAGSINKLGSVNSTVDALRRSLFGTGMNHGGLSAGLFDRIDGMLFQLFAMLRQRE